MAAANSNSPASDSSLKVSSSGGEGNVYGKVVSVLENSVLLRNCNISRPQLFRLLSRPEHTVVWNTLYKEVKIKQEVNHTETETGNSAIKKAETLIIKEGTQVEGTFKGNSKGVFTFSSYDPEGLTFATTQAFSFIWWDFVMVEHEFTLTPETGSLIDALKKRMPELLEEFKAFVFLKK